MTTGWRSVYILVEAYTVTCDNVTDGLNVTCDTGGRNRTLQGG